MQSMPPGPFLGSMPSPDFGGARLARQMDLMCSSIVILATAGVFVGAWVTSPYPEWGPLLQVADITALTIGIICIALMKSAVGWQRFGTFMILEAVNRRLSLDPSTRAVRLSQEQTPAGGIGALADAIVRRVRRLNGRPVSLDEPGSLYEAALHQGRAEASRVVQSLYADVEILTEASHTIATVGDGVAAGSHAAETECAATEAAISRLTERVTALTRSVAATTGEVQRLSAGAIGLSDVAFTSQRRVAALEDRTANLMLAIENNESASRRVANLSQSAEVEAARHGQAGKATAAIATGIKDLAAGMLTGIAGLQSAVETMSGQAAGSAQSARDMCEHVHAHHELGLALSAAVAQQGEEIEGILRALNEARSGFVTLRASVEAVSRHSAAQLADTRTMRDAATRLPAHADAMARILRDLPDFAPPHGFNL